MKVGSLIVFVLVGCATTQHAREAPPHFADKMFYAKASDIASACVKALGDLGFDTRKTTDGAIETNCVDVRRWTTMSDDEASAPSLNTDLCKQYRLVISVESPMVVDVRVESRTLESGGNDMTASTWNDEGEHAAWNVLFKQIRNEL